MEAADSRITIQFKSMFKPSNDSLRIRNGNQINLNSISRQQERTNGEIGSEFFLNIKHTPQKLDYDWYKLSRQ